MVWTKVMVDNASSVLAHMHSIIIDKINCMARHERLALELHGDVIPATLQFKFAPAFPRSTGES